MAKKKRETARKVGTIWYQFTYMSGQTRVLPEFVIGKATREEIVQYGRAYRPSGDHLQKVERARGLKARDWVETWNRVDGFVEESTDE